MNELAERVRALSPHSRRRFLSLLGGALAAPWVTDAMRFAARALAVNEAYAQEMAKITYFLEFDLREQADLMHVMVPPSIARYPNRSVGVNGEQLVMFAPQSELKEYPNEVFLTNDSLELAPHIDSIAMLDLGEPGIGNVHGHEAGNAMRSPGRIMDGGASGLSPMWMIDAPVEGQNGASSEKIYASAPTPATVHNYYQKRVRGDAMNGFAFKGVSAFKASVYHFGAGLPDAELTRVRSKQELFTQYGAGLPDNGEQSELAKKILSQAGVPYRLDAGAGYEDLAESFQGLNRSKLGPLELTAEEAAHWGQGVPPQQCDNDNFKFYDCPPDIGQERSAERFCKAQIWEQFAYASKLMRLGRVRSAALEFDFPDLEGDGARTELSLRYQAQQVARPLARFIAELKAAGLYDRTAIAVYTLDSSRRPSANSYGNDGKNSLLLAGGGVKGGYYGDIVITKDLPGGGHQYGFRCPDPATGQLLPTATNWGDHKLRIPSGSVWRTVMKAAGIPEREYVAKFNAQIDAAKPMNFMLKG